MYKPKVYVELTERDWKDFEKLEKRYNKIYKQELGLRCGLILDEKKTFDTMMANIKSCHKRALYEHLELLSYSKLIYVMENSIFGKWYLKHISKKIKDLGL